MKKFIKRLFYNMHWIISIFLIIYTVVPFISPILFEMGHSRMGWWIQTIYKFLCHQRPERSLFLFGEQLTYSLSELSGHGYNGGLAGYTFVGNNQIGYKVAFCVRDTFIYGSMAAAGFVISAIKRQIKIKWYFLVLSAFPMILDGGIQFVSEFLFLTQERWGLDLAKPLYLSNNVTRAITGIFFGLGVGIILFSELKDALSNGFETDDNNEKRHN